MRNDLKSRVFLYLLDETLVMVIERLCSRDGREIRDIAFDAAGTLLDTAGEFVCRLDPAWHVVGGKEGNIIVRVCIRIDHVHRNTRFWLRS